MGEGARRSRGEQLKSPRRRLPMGQRIARHHMQVGVRLYHERRQSAAVSRWRRALQRLSNAEDRFITLGYLAQAFCDAGDYEAMLHYALQQMELATARNDDFMKAEAFLNLAKAHERLADFSKAIAYARASLQHPSMDPRTPGYAHLAIGLAQTGFSQFQAALEAFEAAMHVANETSDKLLELQVCVGLGALFTILRDLSKALIFLRNALAILQSVTVDDVHAKYRCTVLFHLSVALRIRGSLAEAKEACDEALRLSSETGNRTLHARCLTSIADIFREIGESEAKETITKSWARYEEAFRVMRASNDRMGEVLVLASMAKSAGESRSHYTGQCECQAIQLNKKCLEIAKMIGCKHAMLKCHLRLADLYSQLQDDDSEEAARKAASSLTQEMQLFCNFCGQRFGLADESLQALRCSHIFHEKCLHTFLLERADQTCPKCQCRAVIMDNVSLCTPSITSETPTTSQPGPSSLQPQPALPSTPASQPPGPHRPPGGVRTVLVSAVDELGRNPRPQALLQRVDLKDQNHSNHVEMKGEEPRQPLRKKPPPPPRKPNCMTEDRKKKTLQAGGLPLAGVLSLPPAQPLSENGPLVVSRAPTVTDV